MCSSPRCSADPLRWFVMGGDAGIWAAIALAAAVVHATRVAGALLLSRMTMTGQRARLLDALSASVIAAMVAAMLSQSGLREAAAAALAIAVALVAKSAIWGMLAGTAAAALWTNLGHL